MKKLLILLILMIASPVLAQQCSEPVEVARMSPYFIGGSVPVSSSPPSYGGVADAFTDYTADSATTAITLTNAIPAGSRIVVYLMWLSASQVLNATPATDTGSNTYTKDKEVAFGDRHVVILSAHATTGLSVGHTITIDWDNEAYTYRYAAVYYFLNCAAAGQPDQTCSNTTYATSVTCAASTSTANTMIAGFIYFLDAGTYAGNWTEREVGAGVPSDDVMVALDYQASSAASQDPGGGWGGGAQSYGIVWVAYK